VHPFYRRYLDGAYELLAPKSYASGSIATGRISFAGQAKGEKLEKHSGPPS